MVIKTGFSWVFSAVLLAVFCIGSLSAQNAEVSKATDCPKLTVLGPAGVSQPGDIIWFEATVNPEPAYPLKFSWGTSAETMDNGRFARKIGVRYLMAMRGTTLFAGVTVSGLPSNCSNSAWDAAPLIWEAEAERLSDFSVPIASIHAKNLKAAATELVRNPNSQMYIVEYFPFGTTEARIKRKKEKIMAYMEHTLNFDVSRVTLVAAEADRPRTKIYRIPPGARNPNP